MSWFPDKSGKQVAKDLGGKEFHPQTSIQSYYSGNKDRLFASAKAKSISKISSRRTANFCSERFSSVC